jgi:hypothetical protein
MSAKNKFKIYTPNNAVYIINELGQIIRTDMKFSGSDTWKMQGLSHVKMNWFIPFKDITPELLKTLPLLYKNGNPQFTVRDLDYGTTREWGNTKYHGVKEISFFN